MPLYNGQQQAKETASILGAVFERVLLPALVAEVVATDKSPALASTTSQTSERMRRATWEAARRQDLYWLIAAASRDAERARRPAGGASGRHTEPEVKGLVRASIRNCDVYVAESPSSI